MRQHVTKRELDQFVELVDEKIGFEDWRQDWYPERVGILAGRFFGEATDPVKELVFRTIERIARTREP